MTPALLGFTILVRHQGDIKTLPRGNDSYRAEDATKLSTVLICSDILGLSGTYIIHPATSACAVCSTKSTMLLIKSVCRLQSD